MSRNQTSNATATNVSTLPTAAKAQTAKEVIAENIKAKCDRHPRYNPQRDGRGGIKGRCSTCFTLLDLHQARLTLEAAHRDFIRKATPWTHLRLKRAKPPAVDEEHPEQK